ncbi:hypothetical protein IAT38_001839 [Cryptococcus sp. DSM 104549]
MTFPGGNSDINSLLALLRESQDGPPAAPASSSSSNPQIPSSSQLDDLLTSLRARPPAEPPRKTTGSARHDLMEPFGPVGQTAGPSRIPSGSPSMPTGGSAAGAGDAVAEGFQRQKPTSGDRNRETKRPPRERVEEAGYGAMGLGKALPILTELLEDENFKAELKKMKSDQDALERRLWAKGEKIKAEHKQGVKAEVDIARISRRPLPAGKQAEWEKVLAEKLAAFHRQQCFPPLDGLAARHHQRLVDLGVPGLGDGAPGETAAKQRERQRAIIGVLEEAAGLRD